MYDANVLGMMRVTRALLPLIIGGGDGHIVLVGSIAGREVYDGGAGYTAAKHAARAVNETLRLELLGQPVRVTEIDPGMVETEFSLVRFDGDEERAAKTYEGLTPADGRRHRRLHRLRRDPALARRHRRDGGQAARPGDGDPLLPPLGASGLPRLGVRLVGLQVRAAGVPERQRQQHQPGLPTSCPRHLRFAGHQPESGPQPHERTTHLTAAARCGLVVRTRVDRLAPVDAVAQRQRPGPSRTGWRRQQRATVSSTSKPSASSFIGSAAMSRSRRWSPYTSIQPELVGEREQAVGTGRDCPGRGGVAGRSRISPLPSTKFTVGTAAGLWGGRRVPARLRRRSRLTGGHREPARDQTLTAGLEEGALKVGNGAGVGLSHVHPVSGHKLPLAISTVSSVEALSRDVHLEVRRPARGRSRDQCSRQIRGSVEDRQRDQHSRWPWLIIRHGTDRRDHALRRDGPGSRGRGPRAPCCSPVARSRRGGRATPGTR